MDNRVNIKGEESEEIMEAIETFIEENLCGSEFLICDEAGKAEELEDYIKDSLWAFNAEFIIEHTKTYDRISPREYEAVKKSLRKMQEELCESANPLIAAMIEDIDEFIEDAVSADGAGHFLNTYDGNEECFEFDGETYYIYRLN